MSDLIRKAKPKRKARFLCMEGADKLVSFRISTAKLRNETKFAKS